MKLKLIDKKEQAKGTKTFFWQPEKQINFLPGQYYYFTLPKLNYPDSKGSTRHFTISSSPTEGDVLGLTTRIREESGYKKTLDELQIGSVVEGEGPTGTFIFNQEDKGPNVFLAGGIGITPFRCFIKFNIDKNLRIPMHMIYSNSNPDEIAFKSEIEEWSKSNDFIKMESIVTATNGRVDQTKITKFIENWKLDAKNCTWWIAGPPAFSDAMEDILGKMGVTSDKIRSEKFTGY